MLVKIFGWIVAIISVLSFVIWFYQKGKETKEMISNYSADNIYVSECVIVEPRKEFIFDDISDFKIEKNIYIDTTYWIKVQKVNPTLFDSNKPYLYQVSKADTSMFRLGTKFNSLVELEKKIK